MFSGIIGEIGRVESRVGRGGTVTFRIRAPMLAPDLKPGDSVAVNGVCQTVTAADGQAFSFDSVVQTLRNTNLRKLTQGSQVNLEAALRLGDRISGHLVSGHVDGTAVIRSVRRGGYGNVDFALQVPDGLKLYIKERGSICLDGVSLTVKAVRGSVVEVTLVPFTLDHTIIRDWRVGSLVNVEVDQLAKYLAS